MPHSFIFDESSEDRISAILLEGRGCRVCVAIVRFIGCNNDAVQNIKLTQRIEDVVAFRDDLCVSGYCEAYS